MQFAHISDTHLGYRQRDLPQREEDFYDAFSRAVDEMIKEKVEFVLHCGDLFNDSRPEIKSLLKVKSELRRLRDAGIKIVCIAGNHDFPKRSGGIPPHRIFDEIVFLDGSYVHYGDLFIGGISYRAKPEIREVKKRMEELSLKAREFRKKILMLHQGLDKYIPGFEMSVADLGGFDYYAMGHVHKRIVDGRIVYPGSTEMWRIDEYEDWRRNGKGFYIVDLSTQDPVVHSVNLEIREFLKLQVSKEELEPRLEELRERVRNCMVHITVVGRDLDAPRLRALIEEKLRGALHVDSMFQEIEIGGINREEISSEVSVKMVLDEFMKDFTDQEREFAYELYQALCSDVSVARELARKFFERYDHREH